MTTSIAIFSIVFCLHLPASICNSTSETPFSNVTDVLYDDYVIPEEHTTCSDGDVYTSMEECTGECWRIHEGRDTPETVSNSTKVRFKVVELDLHEYSVAPDGSLFSMLPIVKLPPNTFSIARKSKRAQVCYPLADYFVNCTKWSLYDDEYVLMEKSRSLYLEELHFTYKVDEFFLDKGFNEAIVCIKWPTEDERKEEKESMDKLHLAAYMISAISLVFTFILSILIPELNIRHNKILMSHISILTTFYILMVIRNLIPVININGCLSLAFFLQFSILSSFFWINVQAIDLFIRFVRMRGNVDERIELKQYIIYSLYAWGVPITVTVVTMVMDRLQVQTLYPNFKRTCWFQMKKDKMTVLVYLYGPIAFLLLTNVVLFILTILKLRAVGKNVNHVNKKIHYQLLKLYLKLVVVMGLCWIMEIISWIIGGDERIWYFTDLINAFQGFLIFLVYICKPSYIRRLFLKTSFFENRPKWWPWKRNSNSVDGMKRHGTLSTTTSLTGHECSELPQSNVAIETQTAL